MLGLEKLPGATKNVFTPNFLLAPWLTSKSIDKSLERVFRAYPDRTFILDLDRDYSSKSDGDAFIQFSNLKDSSKSYKGWIDFVKDFDNCVPCLQYKFLSKEEIKKGITDLTRNNSYFAVRFVMPAEVKDLDTVISSLNDIGLANFFFILEGGWARDVLLLEASFSGLIRHIGSSLQARVPIVISCTSIPEDYSKIEGVDTIAFNNRQLISNLQKADNSVELVYGDWASTRPRRPTGPMNAPRPRIDYPIKDSWIISRLVNRDNGTYKSVAHELSQTQAWKDNFGLGIWGETMIHNTFSKGSFGIDTPQKNVASRVNIHLHNQAFYELGNLKSLDLDDDYEGL